jgi:DNA invertase Pin-like site-specific DNA recombinase
MSDNTKPRVYSYIRFSTRPQAEGDSERRQTEAFDADWALKKTQQFAERKGLEFDESFRLKDEGLSGYYGTHRKKGALGLFLKSVQAGEVPQGSILVVEKASRLSREGVYKTLKEVVFDLLEHGVVLQFLRPELTFTKEDLEGPMIHVLVALLQGAYQESKDKSDYGLSCWGEKRKAARAGTHLLSARCPAWLTARVDHSDPKRPQVKGFEVIPEAVDAVRRIFELRNQGIGPKTITRKLNAEAAWSPPRSEGRKTDGWRESYVRKILRSRSVLGEYQPRSISNGKLIPTGEPIPNYYPAVVDPGLFEAVQQKMDANPKTSGGRTGKAGNLLAHLAKCAYCGGPMAFVDGGPGNRVYLVCDNGRRGIGCARHSIRYDETERLLLDNCPKLKPEQVLPDLGEQTLLFESLRQRLAGKVAQLGEIEKRIGNLIDQIAGTDDKTIRSRYEQKVKELGERQATLRKESEADEAELRRVEGGTHDLTAWQRNLKGLRRELAKGDPEVRMRTRAHLRELINKVEVFAVGHRKELDPHAEGEVLKRWRKKLHKERKPFHPKAYPPEMRRELYDARDGDPFREEMLQSEPECLSEGMRDDDFIEYILARRRTKEGRFIRVWFKGGGVVNLAPDGSLANGVRLDPGKDVSGVSMSWTYPDVEVLLEDFEAQHTQSNGRKRKHVRS